jgi:hypothetical protein
VDPRFSWAPTPPGRYTLAGDGVHVSASWKYSQIPFGAELRERDGEIQFRNPGEPDWRLATGPESVFRDRPETRRFERKDFLIDGRLPARWELNDFGHRAIYLRNAGGRIVGHLIHPTALGERRYGKEAPLLESHGCEHMRPMDLDEALSKGYFRPGVPFTVQPYERGLPGDARAWLAAHGRVEAGGAE